MKSKSVLRRMMILKLIVLAAAVTAFAQSTDESNPTAIDASGYTGKGPGKETNYFYSFTGGPGDVTVTIGLKAKSYSTFCRMEVFDSGMRTVATANMNAATTTGGAGESRTFTLPATQKVLIKLTLDANLASYKISLGGAVGNGDASEGAGAGGNGGMAKPNKDLLKNIDLTKFPKPVSVPKSGKLIVLMKDGSKQEFDLAEVKSVVTVAN
jgi:hypothetical protein